ncbi:MlaA family lipoprotein [Fusobacterium necrogenes]|uniref:MlaA family lipoprotein n=1 Tax=Fusobacterium necrogenes TaxID=858 RepID=UPI00255D0FF5|nr:VacJ family lipoprotein [Fusobacterium necrogenes]
MKINRLIIIFMLILSITTFSKESEEVKNIDNSFEYFEVYDPLEPINRRIYYFNYQFDKYIFLPSVKFYRAITPELLRKGVKNFFNNAQNISTTGNSLLQLKIKKAMRAIGRFTMNSAVGIGGIVDVASSMGMPKPYEDFGLTLAHYGVRKGPYLILPILGPSSLRDAFGMGVDIFSRGMLYYISDLDILNNTSVSILYAIDKRAGIPFEYHQTGSPFEYEYIRFLYCKYRRLQIELGSEVF